ncbi:cell division protein FtsX [Altericista sp. CCNU0014]|uniref:cell division protein FtsX n=1 Tax=Altericista sp. CCNU0014 TaxID=3082949 RepID=UPI00384FA2E3
MRRSTLAVSPAFKVTFTQMQYLAQETLRGLRRGGWMNWAAISTVTVLLFLFGISLQTSWQVNGMLQNMGSQLEISAYLRPNLSGETLQQQLAQMPDVASVQLLPRAEAWQQLVADLGATDLQGATDALGQNPLVDQLKIRARSGEQVPKLAQMLSSFSEIEHVSYLNEVMQNLAQLNQGLGWMGWGTIGLLTLTALAVINTTIRLIVVTRHQEIEVMQLVGATTLWIYLPFLLQGLVFGLLGGVMAIGFMAIVHRFMAQLLISQPAFLQSLAQNLQLSTVQSISIPLTLLGFGSFVGLSGSFLAVRRFLMR